MPAREPSVRLIRGGSGREQLRWGTRACAEDTPGAPRPAGLAACPAQRVTASLDRLPNPAHHGALMTRTTVLAAILVAAALTGASARTDPGFSADRIKAHITFLADDLLEGREAGTRGHEIAA